jgi:hypothetical protein
VKNVSDRIEGSTSSPDNEVMVEAFKARLYAVKGPRRLSK